jgi:hypothetical protein
MLTAMSETGQREWEIYEQVAGELLAKLSTALGLELDRVEGKQMLPGESGTEWEIDRVGITNGGEKVVAIECRRYPDDTLNQQAIAAMAYTMRDVWGQKRNHRDTQRGSIGRPKGRRI